MTLDHSLDATSAALGACVTDSIRPLAAGYQTYGLLDYPSHRNIGDSAIWLGEIAALKQVHGRLPGYVSHSRFDPREPARFLPGGLIYLHGGGNFGDIWPKHQLYREAVIAAHPDHRVIQLPQSLHFRKPEGIERTKRVIGAHRDFHLMVRDNESLAFSRQHFDCPVYLVPDCAFCIDMGPVPRRPQPAGVLCLLRTDQESRPDAKAGSTLFGDAVIADWAQFGEGRSFLEKSVLGGLIAAGRVPGLGMVAALREPALSRMAHDRVMLGLAQLDTAEVVVTDRLHGHILATLLNKPHVVIDNFYGKIANFIRAWGKDDVTLQARDFSEAAEMAQSLLTRVRTG
jgi:exopolysaccharide biosynthesis predicted pyruvyltransferase EpsI